jgi:hypothetical protein
MASGGPCTRWRLEEHRAGARARDRDGDEPTEISRQRSVTERQREG